MPRIVFFIAVLSSLLFSCSNGNRQPDLTVACAASAQFAVRELAAEYAKADQLNIEVITGSSGKLTTQLMNGAPFGIFFSANLSYPQMLANEGRTIGDVVQYGKGIPVFWTSNEAFDLSRIGWLMQMDKVNKIAIPDPKNAPYGEKAMQFLNKYDLYSRLQWKFVFGESISQVNEYIMSGNAAIGVTAKSIVSSPKLKGIGQYKEFEQPYWIDQGAVAIKNGQEDNLKTDFLQFVQSNAGKEILKKYGFAF